MLKNKVIHSIKNDFVCVIATCLAIITMFLVPPNIGYLEYIDVNVICILFCLMCVVAGFQDCGLIQYISNKLLHFSTNLKNLTIILMLMCFVVSMFLTNDVALIAFVPLTLTTLTGIKENKLIYIIVILTMAANLGSMLTPIGNPQNLYLYSKFHLSITDFMITVAPICFLSLLLLFFLSMLIKSEKIELSEIDSVTINKRDLVLFAVVFFICILSVLRVLDYRICFAFTLLIYVCKFRYLLRKVDYGLLITFCSFFLLVGNLGNLDAVKQFITSILAGNEMIVSIATSQIISNVPAAIMLSGFTDHWRDLLIGINIGGLGTLVASLASLISFKLYLKAENAKPLKYLVVFSSLSLAVLIILLLFIQLAL